MKNAGTTFELSEQELLEKATNSRLNSEAEMEEMEIKGSPFKAIRLKGGGWFAGWGHSKMTEEFKTVEELLIWIDSNYWNFLITVLVVMMDARDLKKMADAKEYMDKMNEQNKLGNEEHLRDREFLGQYDEEHFES